MQELEKITCKKLYVPMSDGIHAVRVHELLIEFRKSEIIKCKLEIAPSVKGGKPMLVYYKRDDKFSDQLQQNFYKTVELAKAGLSFTEFIYYCKPARCRINPKMLCELYPYEVNYEEEKDGPLLNYSWKWNGVRAAHIYPYNYEEYGNKYFVYDVVNGVFPEIPFKVYRTKEDCEADNSTKVFEFD